MRLELVDWRAVPAFDADGMADGMPAAVIDLRERLRRADAVLIAPVNCPRANDLLHDGPQPWVAIGAAPFHQ